MKQVIAKIEVKYGYKLVTDPEERKQKDWLGCCKKSLNALRWVDVDMDNGRDSYWYYIKPWPIPEGWELVPVEEKRPVGYKYWDMDYKKFVKGKGLENLKVKESDSPVICKINVEPKVYWGKLEEDCNLPLYCNPWSVDVCWDRLALGAKNTGWILWAFAP